MDEVTLQKHKNNDYDQSNIFHFTVIIIGSVNIIQLF